MCSNTHVEIQGITLTGERDSQQLKPIEVVLIYRPPKGNENIALQTIHDFMNNINELDKKELIVMGDLNWNLLDKKSIGYKAIHEIMNEHVLRSHISQATRITANHESLIDLMLSNLKNVSYAGCINYSLSDHFPVYLIIKKRVKSSVVRDTCRNPFKASRETKLQSQHFKVIHRIFPCSSYLWRIRIQDSDWCRFCNKTDLITHHLFSCAKVTPFWASLCIWFRQSVNLYLDQLTAGIHLWPTQRSSPKGGHQCHLIGK